MRKKKTLDSDRRLGKISNWFGSNLSQTQIISLSEAIWLPPISIKLLEYDEIWLLKWKVLMPELAIYTHLFQRNRCQRERGNQTAEKKQWSNASIVLIAAFRRVGQFLQSMKDVNSSCALCVICGDLIRSFLLGRDLEPLEQSRVYSLWSLLLCIFTSLKQKKSVSGPTWIMINSSPIQMESPLD